ncbi:mannosyltransferase [Rhodococcus sp. D2-41]|nr:mannosyltransferase [Rhodococcus sp. D2-41]MDG3012737.1 mannosyltransferase [Rhodococcus sp. D2-41]
MPPSRSTAAPTVPVRVARWVQAHALWLLALSMLIRLVWTLFGPNGHNLVDLHVYVDGSAVLRSGHLYDFTFSRYTPDFPLPFTYPPFAAIVFFPLHYLPFELVGVCWQILTVAALYGVVRISFELLLGKQVAAEQRWRTAAALWTVLGMWLEPVRTTLDYGQVNVFLVLGVMVAVRSTRWWLAGGLVGFVAGIKLTPAVTGLYFLARRRWKEAVFSGVAFLATIGISYLVMGHEAHRYFTKLLGDPNRIGPVGSVINQSMRGALSRIVGHDVGSGPLWLGGMAVTVVLCLLAWRALGRDDRLGTLVIVQLFGLLASPISWTHHWVWVVPMLIWMLHGPMRQLLGTKILAGAWLVAMLVGVAWVLSFFQPTIWEISRHWVLAWLGTVNVVGALALLAWVAYAGRRGRALPSGAVSDTHVGASAPVPLAPAPHEAVPVEHEAVSAERDAVDRVCQADVER